MTQSRHRRLVRVGMLACLWSIFVASGDHYFSFQGSVICVCHMSLEMWLACGHCAWPEMSSVHKVTYHVRGLETWSRNLLDFAEQVVGDSTNE